MKILMVTPHVPPHQAANALLPHLLGEGLKARGHEVRVLTLGRGPDTADTAFVRRRSRRLRKTRMPQALEAAETWLKGVPLVKWADVVHVHSNTWMNQVAASLAFRKGKPYLLTHYGTEIWHHDGRDAVFRRLNERAGHVTFYSRALYDRGVELKVPLRAASVVYPPVADSFHPLSAVRRAEVRRAHVPGGAPLLLNVKRLHPLADQATLLRAMAVVRQKRPEARLLIAGTGDSEPALRALASELHLDSSVRFLGLVKNDAVAELQGAADVFVLSSVLEATPTVALEALACGTPVVSTDNPGGVELGALFGGDVRVVPKSDPEALAAALLTVIAAPHRTGARTAALVAERFRLDGVVEAYLALYRAATQA